MRNARPRLRQSIAAGPTDQYSRRVALLKRLLPALGGVMLVFVAVWPRLGPIWDKVRLGIPAIDLRDARELRMINPRYAGVDRLGRPYVLTAAVGRQVPNDSELMALDQPRAEVKMHSGAIVTVSAASGVYQGAAQLLDLFTDVTLVHENGTRFVTQAAHLNLADNTAEGHDPVAGHGPSGDISGQGFRILDKGEDIEFSGRSDALLKSVKPASAPARPPTIPAAVARTAAEVEDSARAAEAGRAVTQPPPLVRSGSSRLSQARPVRARGRRP